jgi:hypothetical protein
MTARKFDFYVKQIEDAMTSALVAVSGGPVNGYAKGSKPYDGELDDEELGKESKTALSRLVSRLPLFFASYAGGRDEGADDSSWLFGEPREVRHLAVFTVLVCAVDSRGDRANQTQATQGIGAYRMISDAQQALFGRQFEVVVEEESVIINYDPFQPIERGDNVRFVARRNELVVYAIHFQTSFVYTTFDWRDAATQIELIKFGVDPANAPSGRGGNPGVHFTERG